MDKKFLEKIEKKLLEEKKELLKELANFTRENKHIKGDFKTKYPKYGDEEDENIQEVATYEKNLSLEGVLEIELKEINQALDRIKKGTFGTCEKCGKKIEKKRLTLVPQTKFCIKCK